MDLTPILARLQDQLGGFKKVGSAADLDAIGQGVIPAPSCYLVPMSESAEESSLLGAYEQRLTVGFSVILVCANKRDATGEAALAHLEGLRAQIKAALLNWSPQPEIGEPVRFSAGHLLRFDDGLLWWSDDFNVNSYWRSE